MILLYMQTINKQRWRGELHHILSHCFLVFAKVFGITGLDRRCRSPARRRAPVLMLFPLSDDGGRATQPVQMHVHSHRYCGLCKPIIPQLL